MSLIYAGGLVSLCVIGGLLAGYARVFSARRPVYYGIVLLMVLIAVSSQFLPEIHRFRVAVNKDLHALFYLSYIAVPALIYSLALRWIRRKVKSRDDS